MKGNNHVILLNPPSTKIAIRDNYCSKVSQAAYINHPIDLLIQSGYLKPEYQVHLIDAVVQKLSESDCLARIKSFNPKAVFALTGNATWNTDSVFLEHLKSLLPQIKLVASGDIFLEDPVGYLTRNPSIDAILTDYTVPSLTAFFNGTENDLREMVVRNGSKILDYRTSRATGEAFTIPIPMHELFTTLDYRYPFVKHRPFATIMTEFGCPFRCAFCVMGTLGSKYRTIDNILEELAYLKTMGIRDIFFVDQSFGSRKDRNDELCTAMIENNLTFDWLCFSRVDLLDEHILSRMKQAGCHTIILGVETASQSLLDRYRKGYTLSQVRNIFSELRRLKIRSVATFLLGLPGETWDSACDTIQFAKTLACDYASINIAVPRMGTDFRAWAINQNLIDPSLDQFDQSGSHVVMETSMLSKHDLLRLKKKAILSFYFDPFFLARRLAAIRSLSELGIQLREGCYLLKNWVSRSDD
jgi:anaerobic magnesium-protoporphyrin IX monomethyl ester cyclase